MLALAGAWPAHAARDVAALKACMAANLPQKSLQQDFKISQTDRTGGKRELSGTWYWQKQGDRSAAMVQFSTPPDLAGTSYLFTKQKGAPERLFVYLPAVRNVKEVHGGQAAQSLMGTGISAFDIKFLISGTRGGQLTFAGTTVSDGRPAETWRYIPPTDPNILYDKLEIVIDTERCVPMQAQLWGGQPWKTLAVDTASVTQTNGHWRARKVTLVDLREGSTTVIETHDDRFDGEIPGRLFDSRKFYKGN